MSTQHTLYATKLCGHLTKWISRRSRKLPSEWLSAGLMLLGLDLAPAHKILRPLYAPTHRGIPPYEKVCMLRALLLMIMLKVESIPKWAAKLKTYPRLARIAGFDPDSTPVAGTFYLFIGRLEDGEYHRPCEHQIKKSSLRKRKHIRNLANEKKQRLEDSKRDVSQNDSVTRALFEQLQKDFSQPRAKDISQRLSDILIQCAIIPSAQRGLLGDTQKLTIAGDGSTLYSGANPNGKPACNCHKQGIYKCDHSRFYTDPTANWGYDSYRDCYYFGHTFYQHVVSTQGHDLPIHVGIGPASETDFTLSLKNLDKFRKALKENGLNWQVQQAIYDAGHDALGIYEYLLDAEIDPIIALNSRTKEHHNPTGTAKQVNEEGIPLCPAAKPMRRVSHNPKRHRTYYNCPVKRPTHRNGKYMMVTYAKECPLETLCQPSTKMGPVVYVNTADDPRLYPKISRKSKQFKKLMNLCSGCERSNSVKKVTYKLGRRVCRNATHYLVRLYLISIVEHACVWLSDELEKVEGNTKKLIKDIRKRL